MQHQHGLGLPMVGLVVVSVPTVGHGMPFMEGDLSPFAFPRNYFSTFADIFASVQIYLSCSISFFLWCQIYFRGLF
jgi:hypothetical protein